MTNHNSTHITLVCDRSGSMQFIQDDAQGAVRNFIAEQQKVPGAATLLLVDFDAPTYGDDSWYRIVHDGDLASAPDYDLVPRGGTALRDAIGRSIKTTGERLAAMPEDDRPGHVFFVVQTDGQENSSREWTQAAVNTLIKEHEDVWKWTFIFLASGPGAWSNAHAYVGTQMVDRNLLRGGATGQSVGSTYAFATAAVAATRTGARSADAGYAAEIDDEGNITEDEPKAKVGPKGPLP